MWGMVLQYEQLREEEAGRHELMTTTDYMERFFSKIIRKQGMKEGRKDGQWEW